MGLVDFVWATFGRSLATRLAASAAFVAIVAVVIFSPHGLRAADVVRILDHSTIAALVTWCAWLLVIVPVIADAMRAPGTAILRSLPLREGSIAIAVFGLAAMVQIPWAAVFFRGAGALRGVTALAISSACVATLVGRWRYRLFVFPIAIALVFVPSFVALPIALGLSAIAGFDAWRHGAVPRAGIVVPLPRIPALATSMALLLQLLRTERTRLAITIAFAAGTRVVVSRLDASSFAKPTTLLAIATSLVASALAPPLVRDAARLAWLTPRLPLACALGLLFVLASAYAWWSGPFALASVLVAEGARRRKWRGSVYGLASFGAATIAGSTAWWLS